MNYAWKVAEHKSPYAHRNKNIIGKVPLPEQEMIKHYWESSLTRARDEKLK
jgi:hypothetical protein